MEDYGITYDHARYHPKEENLKKLAQSLKDAQEQEQHEIRCPICGFLKGYVLGEKKYFRRFLQTLLKVNPDLASRAGVAKEGESAALDGVIARMGLAYLMGFKLGMDCLGFWLGDALAGFMPFVIGFSFYLSGRWKEKDLKKR